MAVPDDTRRTAALLMDPSTPPDVLLEHLTSLVTALAPEGRELMAGAVVKSGLVPYLVQLLELPDGAYNQKHAPYPGFVRTTRAPP